MTAYAIATGLERATLVYAKSEGPGATHRIVHVGKIIDAIAIDLSAPPGQLLGEIGMIAESIRMAATTAGLPPHVSRSGEVDQHSVPAPVRRSER